MKNKILVIGSSNIDMIMKMSKLPEKGETITDADFLQTYGGKGANQAVGAARAGGDVTFITSVGDDANTLQMLTNYEKDGIDTKFIFHEKNISSGHALVMIGSGGNNYLSVAPGANYQLTPDKIDRLDNLFQEAGIIVMQYEIPVATIKHVLVKAQRFNVPVMWNFAPARDFDLSYLDKIEYLILNETEASFISGIKVNHLDDAKNAAIIIRKKGARQVIITMGEKGSLTKTDEEEIYLPSFKVNAVDTTAAGDVFCGSLAVALLESKPLTEAIQFATAASALAVTKLGAQPSVPFRKEIDKFLEANI